MHIWPYFKLISDFTGLQFEVPVSAAEQAAKDGYLDLAADAVRRFVQSSD